MQSNTLTSNDYISSGTAAPIVVGDLISQTTRQWQEKWEKLISRTNWEKGKLIQQWRTELIEQNAPATAYSDEAWSRQVGAVTPQHVGRLRRVYERFNDMSQNFPQLYWSHFQAALDWDDAEKWLQDAADNKWSISQMRMNRWESLGSPADKKPKETDVHTSDLDEDVNPENDEPKDKKDKDFDDSSDSARGEVKEFDPNFGAGSDGPLNEKPDFGDESEIPFQADPLQPTGESMFAPPQAATEPSRPFEDIPDFPEDLTNAFDSLKIAILNHKLAGWEDVSCDDVCAALNAMKQLAMNK